ncbi:MAG TPA: hypothetical protein PKD26_11850, partial [Pyrinomonadaceae bacterium]|nr:hypothetical protein [Pyrinomonadaceae bacterium]
FVTRLIQKIPVALRRETAAFQRTRGEISCINALIKGVMLIVGRLTRPIRRDSPDLRPQTRTFQEITNK